MPLFVQVWMVILAIPITPQSEVLETLTAENPEDVTGMVVLQAESEVSSINMVYGGAGAGKKVMTSSSSPGVSLMAEGLSYLAGAELPCLVVNVMRGGQVLVPSNPAKQTTSKQLRAVVMATITSSYSPPTRYKNGRLCRPRYRTCIQVPQPRDDAF